MRMGGKIVFSLFNKVVMHVLVIKIFKTLGHSSLVCLP